MTRTLLALATVALVAAFASNPASAEHEEFMSQLQWSNQQLFGTSPKGLATKKRPHADAIDSYYSNEGSWGGTSPKRKKRSSGLVR